VENTDARRKFMVKIDQQSIILISVNLLVIISTGRLGQSESGLEEVKGAFPAENK